MSSSDGMKEFAAEVRDELSTVKTNGAMFDPESALMRITQAATRLAEEAQARLRPYLAHYGTCTYIKEPLGDTPCTCGLDAALKPLDRGKHE